MEGWLVVIPGMYVAGLVASVLYGVPAKLPGVALGLPALLHLERAAAVLAVIGVVSIFAYMTSLGHLPSQLGNIGYAVVGRQHELEQHVAELRQGFEERLAPLEQSRQAGDQTLELVRGDLARVGRRLVVLETDSNE